MKIPYRALLRKLFSIDSIYSFMKWIKLAVLAVAVLSAVNVWFILSDLGLFGMILTLILFLITSTVLLLAASGISAVIGLILSGIRQVKSYKDSKDSGSPELLELDRMRLKAMGLNLLLGLIIIILIAIGLVVMYMTADMGDWPTTVYFIAAFIVVIVISIAFAPLKAKYKESFKENVVKKGLQSVLEDVDLRPTEKLDEAYIKESGLFSDYDLYYGNDFLTAKHNGYTLLRGDATLQKIRERVVNDEDGSHTETYYESVFAGSLTLLDYDAISNEPVHIYPRTSKLKPGEAIETELDSFNRRFSVTAPSPAAALRILTPPVLEGIVSAAEKIKEPVSMSFVSDKIFIAIHGGDAFEGTAGGRRTLTEQRNKVRQDIENILALVRNIYLTESKSRPDLNKTKNY